MPKNLFEGIQVGKNKVDVNFHQFVDDIVFFGKTSWRNVMTTKSMLRYFELTFGLKVNFFKCSLQGIALGGEELMGYAKAQNCRLMVLSFKYLGVLMDANQSKEEM